MLPRPLLPGATGAVSGPAFVIPVYKIVAHAGQLRRCGEILQQICPPVNCVPSARLNVQLPVGINGIALNRGSVAARGVGVGDLNIARGGAGGIGIALHHHAHAGHQITAGIHRKIAIARDVFLAAGTDPLPRKNHCRSPPCCSARRYW